MAEPTCPRCRTVTLDRARVEEYGADVHFCSQCRGMWLPGTVMTRFLRDDPRLLTPPVGAKAGNRLCPACRGTMVAFDYLQTFATIDLCRACNGVWLDDRELKEIVTIRDHHRAAGTLDTRPPVTGVKGTLIHLINRAISSLSDFTDY